MKKEMTLKARFILTSYCSVVISIMLIGIASYCLLGSMSKKFVLQTSEEAVRQKNEDIQTKLDGIEVTLRDIIYNSELQQTLTDYQGAGPYSRSSASSSLRYEIYHRGFRRGWGDLPADRTGSVLRKRPV